MRRLMWRRTAAALLAAALLTPAAGAAEVTVDGVALGPEDGWVTDGTSYVTLRAFCQAAQGYTLHWNGAAAGVTGADLWLEAYPGAQYVQANDRALYVDGGVGVRDGRAYLPLWVLAEAADARVSWDGATAAMTTRGAKPKQADYDQEDLYWLSRVICAESGAEPLLGQIAVGNVVLNRVRSSQYPDTIKAVVFDRKNGVQFEPTANGTIYKQPTQTSLLAAKLCLEGADVVGDSLYFFAPALSAGRWIVNNCDYTATIGCHQFYRER